jgi:large subunit ribosomal protein L31e
MGNSENQRNRENQPEKGALDTNQDKGIEEPEQTAETEEKEEEPLETEMEEEVKEESVETAEIEEAPEEAEAEKEEEEAAEELAPEEEKEEKKKREEAEEEIVEERIYTIPLSRALIAPRKKRAPRAVRIVKSFIQKHMKIEEKTATAEEEAEGGKLVISEEVNKKLWSRGIEKPPRNIRVRAVKDKEGIVTLYLAEGD